MTKKTFKNTRYFMLYLVLVVLLTINIFFIIRNMNDKIGEECNEIIINKCEDSYIEKQKYYTEIDFKKFQTLFKSKEVSSIAVVDNSSKTYNKFIETINKISYYNNSNLYMLELSKLSKKNEITFYEIDERLKKLESGYIITVNEEKVISLTSFNEYYLNVINESIK